MSILICPGVHNLELTQSFLQGLPLRSTPNLLAADYTNQSENLFIFPAQCYPAYSAFHIVQFLQETFRQHQLSSAQTGLVFLSFSAGVAGAVGAAWAWQQLGGQVKALIALDGWGVPLYGDFPIHRVSHDYFTHWSSALWGAGADSFYAEPAIDHLELWRSPQTAQGWWVPVENATQQSPTATTAAIFLTVLLQSYGESGLFVS
ncbi:hypothetical protein [Trichocoleus sp. FACHB-262]|uniref:hypothetical protein n=1 Tax=Trichocoleus sp. FACHB-262 TaxID=2692869 RepID=UPI0016869921|nr:hypothetical protein [Trichocoleus sp. FACHB-262]MBD2121908.1 hypothetical protein [Trichocoleus sp. FACHB-262]